MDAIQKDIIKKVKKILRLAEKAGTEDEAHTAMQMAREIMAKYNLTLRDLEKFDESDCNEASFVIKKNYVPAHIKFFLNAMNVLFQCEPVIWQNYKNNGNRQKIIFIGVGADAIVACQTFQFLMQFAQRKASERGIKQRSRADYFLGFAHIVLKRALEIRKNAQENAQENALVPVKELAIKKYIEKKNMNIGKASGIRKRYCEGSYYTGFEDGRKVGLNRQVEANNQKSLE